MLHLAPQIGQWLGKPSGVRDEIVIQLCKSLQLRDFASITVRPLGFAALRLAVNNR